MSRIRSSKGKKNPELIRFIIFFSRSLIGSISRSSHQSSATSSDPSTQVELKGSDNPALSVDTDEIDSGL